MYEYVPESINFYAIFGVFLGFAIVLMLKNTVIKMLTFVKDLNLND